MPTAGENEIYHATEDGIGLYFPHGNGQHDRQHIGRNVKYHGSDHQCPGPGQTGRLSRMEHRTAARTKWPLAAVLSLISAQQLTAVAADQPSVEGRYLSICNGERSHMPFVFIPTIAAGSIKMRAINANSAGPGTTSAMPTSFTSDTNMPSISISIMDQG